MMNTADHLQADNEKSKGISIGALIINKSEGQAHILQTMELTADASVHEEKDALQRELLEGLQTHEINDVEHLPQEIEDVTKTIEELDKKGKKKQADDQRKMLEELKHLQTIAEKLKTSCLDADQQKYNDLNQELQEGLKHHEIENAINLPQEIEDVTKTIEELDKKGKKKQADEQRRVLEELKHLQAISEKIQALLSAQSDTTWKEREALQKELQEGLSNHEIEDTTNLPQEIEDLTKTIEELDKKGKKKQAEEQRKVLEELKCLQAISEKINTLLSARPDPTRKEREALQRELQEGLDHHEISDAENLSQEIEDATRTIEELDKKGKKKQADDQRKALEELKHLQAVYEKIKTLVSESDPTRKEREALQRELQKGLNNHEINDANNLPYEIEDLNKKIEELDKKGKKKQADEQRKMLEELKHLQAISEKVKALLSARPDPTRKEREALQRELQEGLNNHEIHDANSLPQEVQDLTKTIEELDKKGKKKQADEQRKVLEELNYLLSIQNKIVALTGGYNQGKAMLSKEPAQGLLTKENKNLVRSETLSKSTKPSKDSLTREDEDECLVLSQAEKSEDKFDHNEVEHIVHLFRNFSSMPPCAEGSLMALIYYTLLKLYENEDLSNLKIERPKQLDKDITQGFEKLKAQLKREELDSVQRGETLIKCQSLVEARCWSLAREELETLLRDVRPLDIQETLHLIAKGMKAADLITGENIILLLGGTGSGKSTTIHYLAGSKMERLKVSGKKYHIAPTEIRNDRLKKVITSSSAKSETRYITTIPVNYSDVGANTAGSVILCDTPGFGRVPVWKSTLPTASAS